MDELRAKDLAAIEPPGSISKIVEFAQQLSFGQQGLFAGAELPAPPISARSLASQSMAQQLVAKPYNFFPAANGEGLDALMSRYTIRSRDIQEFTRWLVNWNDTRTQLLVNEAPDQYFLRRATPEMIEHFTEEPDVQRVIVEGRRRTRIVEHEVHETETEEHVTRVHRTVEARAVEQDEPARPSYARRRYGGHPHTEGGEGEPSDAWNDEAAESREGPQPKPIRRVGRARVVEPQTEELRAAVSGVNRGLTTTNIGLGSLAFGIVRGRADMAASMQAQAAATNAVQGSPVSPYMAQPAGYQPFAGGQVYSPTAMGQPLQPGAMHFPTPEVYVSSTPEGPPEGVTTDWPGAPMYRQPGAVVPQPSLDGDQDMVLVSRAAAEEKGMKPLERVPASRSVARGAAVAAAAAAAMLPAAAFAGGGPSVAMLPGFTGAASQAFAGTVAARATSAAPGAILTSISGPGSPMVGLAPGTAGLAPAVGPLGLPGSGPGRLGAAGFAPGSQAGPVYTGPEQTWSRQGFPGSSMGGPPAGSFAISPRGIAAVAAGPALAGEVAARSRGVSLSGAPGSPQTVMPPGSLARRDVMGAVSGAEHQPMLAAPGRSEKAVQTPIPADPLLGQITLVSPPVQVASQASERAGSAVAFDVRDLAKGTGALDALGLAMLKNALPPGAQAIYPALPAGQLGPQAVNLPLAPSLLSQIMTTGYGPQAAAMSGTLASLASSSHSASSGGGGAMPAKIVPTAQRPVDSSTGPLAGNAASGPGSLAHAGAADASRGGALGFLGMPVRLAPSLSGDASVKQAAEARKVLPPGAAAVVRPTEFAALRSKVFTGMNTVHAEPDQTAWQQAAPSFGLRDAEPHTILSPDARIKPPHPSAPLPQMAGGGASPLSKALNAATLIAPAASAALGPGSRPLGGPLLQQAGAAKAAASLGSLPSFQPRMATPAGMAAGGLGSVRFASPTIGSHRATGHPFTPGATPILPRTSGPTIGSRGPSVSAGGPRVASRFTPDHPSIGGGPTATVHETAAAADVHAGGAPPEHSFHAAPSSPIGMAPMGGLRSPAIPAVKSSSTPATPSISPLSRSGPAMIRPTVPTTAGGGSFAGSLGAPTSFANTQSASRGSSSFAPASTSISSRAPAMPIAASVPARPPQASQQAIVQRATGGAVHANSNEHSHENESSTGENPQAQDPGAAAHEINLLANEVWSLLKRKVLHEAERTGRRF